MVIFIFILLSLTLLNHPINFIINLIILSSISIILISLFFKMSWFGMIFILLILGGLLVLFIYMASLTSNKKFPKIKTIWHILFFISTSYLYFNFPLFLQPFSNIYMELNNFTSSFQFFNCLISMLYLFLSMIFILEMISFIKSPLRSKF